MKKLSKKDRIILAVAGVALAIALCCQGWYYWPWFGGRVYRVKPYEWATSSFNNLSVSSDYRPQNIVNHTNYSNHQLLLFFHDIVLRREYNLSINTCNKWVTPVYLFITNVPSERESDILHNACNFLNTIPGFPGILLTDSEPNASITITFLDDAHFSKGVFAYFDIISKDSMNNLERVEIFIRSSLDPEHMASVIWEELLQSTGPMNDTALTSDTLFTSASTNILQASDLDRTILEMLYHPAIRSGMDYIQCLPFFLKYLK